MVAKVDLDKSTRTNVLIAVHAQKNALTKPLQSKIKCQISGNIRNQSTQCHYLFFYSLFYNIVSYGNVNIGNGELSTSHPNFTRRTRKIRRIKPLKSLNALKKIQRLRRI